MKLRLFLVTLAVIVIALLISPVWADLQTVGNTGGASQQVLYQGKVCGQSASSTVTTNPVSQEGKTVVVVLQQQQQQQQTVAARRGGGSRHHSSPRPRYNHPAPAPAPKYCAQPVVAPVVVPPVVVFATPPADKPVPTKERKPMDPMSIIFSILAAGAVICGALALILSTTRNQNKDTETSKTERTKITADVEIKKAELKDEENKRLAKIEENKLTVATAVVNKTIEKIEPGEKISVNLSAAGVNQTYDRSRVTPEPQCSPRCAGQAQSQSINLGQPQQGGHLDGNVLTDASLKNILDTKFSAVLRPAQQPKQDPPAA